MNITTIKQFIDNIGKEATVTNPSGQKIVGEIILSEGNDFAREEYFIGDKLVGDNIEGIIYKITVK